MEKKKFCASQKKRRRNEIKIVSSKQHANEKLALEYINKPIQKLKCNPKCVVEYKGMFGY